MHPPAFPNGYYAHPSFAHMDANVERQSNFELLRILAMVFIVLHHISVHGGWGNGGVFFPDSVTLNALFLQSLLPLGKIGVNLFVLISGFFLIGSTKSTWPKILRLWLEMVFYSAAISLAFAILGGREFTPREMFAIMTPAISMTWWFMSCYLVMLALSPFMNMALNRCCERDHLKLIICLLLLWSVIPTLTGIQVQFRELTWFLIVYTIGAYVSKYRDRFRSSGYRYLAYAAIAYSVVIATIYVADITGYSSEFWSISNLVDHIIMMNGIPCVIISLSLFLAFIRLPIKQDRAINAVGAATLGVYLIHDHFLMRDYLYRELFDCPAWTDSGILVPYVLMMCAAIFVACTMIEIAREKTIGNHVFLPISERTAGLQSWIDRRIDGHLKG